MSLNGIAGEVAFFREWAKPDFALPEPVERTILFEIEEITELMREIWADQGFLRNNKRTGSQEAKELEWAQGLFMHITVALQLGIDVDRAWETCMSKFYERVEVKRGETPRT